MTSPTAPNETPSGPELQTLLDDALPRVWWKRLPLWLALAAVALASAGWYFWQASNKSKAAPVFVTEAVGKGNLTLSVSANGTL
ncbi:MAG: hypothetical protein RLZZ573_833, partial [Pseudomonadota bacterium]